jgi:hypothetical protein
VPFLGALHASLNTRESCFLTFWSFFNEFYKAVFQKIKNLPAKPKPWKINILLYVAHASWRIVRKHVIKRFDKNKDLAYCTFFDLLDSLIPSTLDLYVVLFRGNHFEKYVETIFKLWTMMCRFQRKNYNKIMLAFLSDIQYWIKIGHPIIQILKAHLNAFDEYPVENFHSLVRRHTNAKVLVPEWLRRDGIFIDYQRHDNDFTQNFRVKKTYPYSKQNIDTMVKSGAIFLLKLFDNFSKNSGKFEVKREGKKIKKSYWYFSGISKGFPGGALPLGHHSNQPPKPNCFCDASECENPFLISGSVKLCGHAYHDDCWNKLNCICVYCHNYLSDSIDELSKSYNKRLEMDNDTQDEIELPNDDLLEEESNNVDAVPAYEELNQKLNKMLMGKYSNIIISIY